MRARGGVTRAARAAAALSIALSSAAASGAAGGDGQPGPRAIWRADVGRAVGRAIAASESCAYAATLDGRIVAVRLTDGRRLWRKRHGDSLPGGVAVYGPRLLAASDEPDGRLYCLSAATGDLLWCTEVGPSLGAPTLGADLVLTAGMRGRVTACSLETGEILWQRPIPGRIRAPLAIAGERVLVPTLADTLLALELRTGDLAWGAAPGGAVYGRPLVDDRGVWTLSYEGELVCWEPATGRALCRTHLEGPFRCGVVPADDGLLAVATGGRIAALDRATLAERWHADLGAAAWLEPLADGGRLWQALGDRTLRGLRLADGCELERHELAQVPSARPVRADARVLVGLASGELVALSGGLPAASNAIGAPKLSGGPHGWKSAEALVDEGQASPARAVGSRPPVPVVVPLWQRELVLASPPAGGPKVVAPGADEGPRLTGAGRLWAAGWIIGTAGALWLQQEAEQAHENYERTGDPGQREDELQRAERLDRAVLGVWIASEAMFLLLLRSWLSSGE